MAFTFKELKQLKNQIAAAAGIDTAAAARVIGYYNGGGPFLRPDIVAAMIAGDFSHVGPALSALGIPAADDLQKGSEPGTGSRESKTAGPDGDNIEVGPDGVGDDLHPDGLQNAPQRKESKQANKRTTKQKKTNTSPQALKGPDVVQGGHDDLGPDDLENLRNDGYKRPANWKSRAKNTPAKPNKEMLKTYSRAGLDPASFDPSGIETYSPDRLPDDFGNIIKGWLEDWAHDNGLDLYKIAGLQWRAACIWVGWKVKAMHILDDKSMIDKNGGRYYSPEKLETLLYIWEYLTQHYKHVPLAADFVAFAGVTRNYFTECAGVTSSQVQVYKKALEIEESGLSAGLVDSRENPTGRIYYTKARLGWRETAAADAAPAVVVVSLGELPKLDKIGG